MGHLAAHEPQTLEIGDAGWKICVSTPALVGQEIYDEEGAGPPSSQAIRA